MSIKIWLDEAADFSEGQWRRMIDGWKVIIPVKVSGADQPIEGEAVDLDDDFEYCPVTTSHRHSWAKNEDGVSACEFCGRLEE